MLFFRPIDTADADRGQGTGDQGTGTRADAPSAAADAPAPVAAQGAGYRLSSCVRMCVGPVEALNSPWAQPRLLEGIGPGLVEGIGPGGQDAAHRHRLAPPVRAEASLCFTLIFAAEGRGATAVAAAERAAAQRAAQGAAQGAAQVAAQTAAQTAAEVEAEAEAQTSADAPEERPPTSPPPPLHLVASNAAELVDWYMGLQALAAVWPSDRISAARLRWRCVRLHVLPPRLPR